MKIYIIGIVCLLTVALGMSTMMIHEKNKEIDAHKARIAFLENQVSKYINAEGDKDTFLTPIKSKEIHKFVNNERKKSGLNALNYVRELERTACIKADDMIKRDYWSHKNPDGQEPWEILTKEAVYYDIAGENLAYGSYSNEDTVKAWMQSAGHRRNILETDFTGEGICVRKATNYRGGRNVVVVQHFYKPWSGGLHGKI